MPKDKGNEFLENINSDKASKKNSLVLNIVILLAILSLVVGILSGVFYVVVTNNINGLADKYRSEIGRIPIYRDLLPPVREKYDLKGLTLQEIEILLAEVKSEKASLQEELEILKHEHGIVQEKLQKHKSLEDENEQIREEIENIKAELLEDRKNIDKLVSNANRSELIAFFERMDPNTSKEIYEEVMKEKKVEEKVREFARIYEGMEARSVSRIFEELGNSQMELIVEILKNIRRDRAAEIIAAMSPELAAEVTRNLSESYRPNF